MASQYFDISYDDGEPANIFERMGKYLKTLDAAEPKLERSMSTSTTPSLINCGSTREIDNSMSVYASENFQEGRRSVPISVTCTANIGLTVKLEPSPPGPVSQEAFAESCQRLLSLATPNESESKSSVSFDQSINRRNSFSHNDRQVEPLFHPRDVKFQAPPIQHHEAVPVEDFVKTMLQEQRSAGPKPRSSSNRKTERQSIKEVHNEWATKINLQVACGMRPMKNIRVQEVIAEAVKTVKTLEMQEKETKNEIIALMKRQAELFDKLVHYKKLLS